MNFKKRALAIITSTILATSLTITPIYAKYEDPDMGEKLITSGRMEDGTYFEVAQDEDNDYWLYYETWQEYPHFLSGG